MFLYLGAMGETLFVFRDAVDDFLRRLTSMLRVTVDQGALQGGEGGFSVSHHC